MLKNAKEKLTDKELVNNMLKSTHEIWLAGLGAYGKAQDEGSKAFASLVKTGTQVETRAIKVAGEKIEQVPERGSTPRHSRTCRARYRKYCSDDRR